MTLNPGSRLGAYEITGSIGVGSMGEVYRAHDPRLGRDVAVKILPESMGKCLEKNPRDRIQTAHEVLLELKALKRAWESGSLEGRPLPQPLSGAVSDPGIRAARAEDLRIAGVSRLLTWTVL